MSEDVVAVVMAGGMGERLRPLTDVRAKPAVPFGGIFRIIDFTLSNCINSGLRRILVLTQYKSYSLSNHLKMGWNFLSRRLRQFIDEIPAQMQLGSSWYTGTADAIRQNLGILEHTRPELILILSGDQIYKMDYQALLRFHQEKHSALTISVVQVDADSARGTYGVLEIDQNERVIGFEEKPAHPKTMPGTNQCLASMGIYVSDLTTLKDNLGDDLADMSLHVIPKMTAEGKPVFAYDFSRKNRIEEFEYLVMQEGRRTRVSVERASDSDYWRDVGTLETYWQASLDLVSAKPRFSLYGERWPIFNCPLYFPPAKFVHDAPSRTGHAINSIVADGVIISGALVRNSILSPGIFIHSYSQVENSVLLGGTIEGGMVTETTIGRGCRIRNAIIDKNVQLSEGIDLGYDRVRDEKRGFKVQPLSGSNDYLVVVPKNFTL
jgi:glucose-1-phosphate adenylyltransferase